MVMMGKVLFLCDQKQCDKCSYPECKHTSDVRHAKNFKLVSNSYNSYGYDRFWELEVEPNAQTPSKCADLQSSE